MELVANKFEETGDQLNEAIDAPTPDPLYEKIVECIEAGAPALRASDLHTEEKFENSGAANLLREKLLERRALRQRLASMHKRTGGEGDLHDQVWQRIEKLKAEIGFISKELKRQEAETSGPRRCERKPLP